MPDTRIGSKLATLRESLHLTVDELAQRCECEPSVIAALEAGELSPSLAPLLRITRALGVRLGTLLDDDAAVGPVVTRAGNLGAFSTRGPARRGVPPGSWTGSWARTRR